MSVPERDPFSEEFVGSYYLVEAQLSEGQPKDFYYSRDPFKLCSEEQMSSGLLLQAGEAIDFDWSLKQACSSFRKADFGSTLDSRALRSNHT